MRLSRLHARLSLGITASGFIALALGMLIGGPEAPIIGLGLFFVFYIAGGSLQMRYLRCPHCGKSVLPAKWMSKTPVVCTNCKSQFLWDR